MYRKVENDQPGEPVTLARAEVSLVSDPLKDSSVEIKVLYSTRAYANAAVDASKLANAFAYYIGDSGILFPTVISDSTAPALCAALRKAVERERTDAQAAANLSRDLLFWYVGARFPPSVGGGLASKAPAAADAALAGFSAAERAVIAETRQILSSPEMMQLRHAHALGKPLILRVVGRLVQYEPNWPFSGMTIFEENGFLLGQQAFSSEEELTKSVLHELYRLATSVARDTGGGGANNAETKAAYEFADRAFNAVFGSGR